MENLKIKAEIRKVEIPENPNLRGFADITIGDIVIKDVSISEVENKTEEGKTFFGFQTPVAYKYENGNGETIYIHTADLTSKDLDVQKKLISEVRKVITEAINSEEANEYGKFVAEKETDISYDKDFIRAYANSVDNEKYPNLRANGSIYFGGILRLNQVRLTEAVNSETNETFTNINFPSEKYEKDGETKYYERVFPIAEGLRKKMNDVMQEAYLTELEKESQEESEDEIEEE